MDGRFFFPWLCSQMFAGLLASLHTLARTSLFASCFLRDCACRYRCLHLLVLRLCLCEVPQATFFQGDHSSTAYSVTRDQRWPLYNHKTQRCSHVLSPSHCQHWLFVRLCGHFARIFFAASSHARPTASQRCCFLFLPPASVMGRFLFYHLLFHFAFKATLLVLGLFLPLVFELLASRTTSLTRREFSSPFSHTRMPHPALELR